MSSASEFLRQIILIEAGEEVYRMYEKEDESNPQSLLISTPAGNLSCKRIFFIKWNPDENISILRQSISDFISNVIQNVLSYQYNSVAFPSIGSNHSNISRKTIIQILIQQLIYQIKSRNLSLIIKFIILPDQQQIYQLFEEELLKSEQSLFFFSNKKLFQSFFIDNQSTSEDQLPSTWQISGEKKKRFVLPFESDEYQKIANEFVGAMKGKMKNVIKIERIENERWYFQYNAHKKDFLKRLNKETEKRLYHGCPENVLNSIIEDCFNRSFAGVNGSYLSFLFN